MNALLSLTEHMSELEHAYSLVFCETAVNRRNRGRFLAGSTKTGADFRLAAASCADFTEARLEHSTFDEADLAYSAFFGAHLTRCTFRFAELYWAGFSHSVMSGVDFTEASLCGADFTGVEGLKSCRFKAAKTDSSTVWPVDFDFEALGLRGHR